MNAGLQDGPINEDKDHVIVDTNENGHADNLIEDKDELDELLATSYLEVLSELEVIVEIDLFARGLTQDTTHNEIDDVI